jgi:hypothetical protein
MSRDRHDQRDDVEHGAALLPAEFPQFDDADDAEPAELDRSQVIAAIALWLNNVIDLSIVADDKRAALKRAPGQLAEEEAAEAERQLGAAMVHLQHLIDMYHAAFGPC